MIFVQEYRSRNNLLNCVFNGTTNIVHIYFVSLSIITWYITFGPQNSNDCLSILNLKINVCLGNLLVLKPSLFTWVFFTVWYVKTESFNNFILHMIKGFIARIFIELIITIILLYHTHPATPSPLYLWNTDNL